MKLERTARPTMAPRRRNWVAGCFLLLLALVPPARAGEQYTLEDCIAKGSVDVCRAAYLHTRSLDALYRLAYAYFIEGRNDSERQEMFLSALVTAHLLASTDPGSELALSGHRLVCLIESDEKNLTARPTLAIEHGMAAYQAPGSGSKQTAEAAACVARARLVAGEYHQAEKFARIAMQSPGLRPNDPGPAITLVDTLRRLGKAADAQKILNDSRLRMKDGCALTLLYLKTGMARDEAPDADSRALASDEYDTAAQTLQSCSSDEQRETYRNSIALNRASRSAQKAPDEATKLLDSLPPEIQAKHDATFLRVIISLSLAKPDLDAARRALNNVNPDSELDLEWQWEDLQLRGVVALRAGKFKEAEGYFSKAAQRVQNLRRASHSSAAYLLASHRAPFEQLISLYAHQGQWKDALKVVLELDASDMLRQGAETNASPALPKVTDLSVDQVLRAWKGRELAILIAPTPWRDFSDLPVVRLEIRDGKLGGKLFPNTSQVLEAAHDLSSDASNKQAAQQLGPLFVPRQPLSATPDVLDVLAIGELSKTPLPALRDEKGDLLLTHRPLARVLSLQGQAAAPSEPVTGPLALYANPDGDLPGAQIEAQLVASLVGKPSAFSIADKATLSRVKRPTLMHLATHLQDDADGIPVLRLADGNLSIADVRELGLAPKLAVLMTCRSRKGGDPEGWDSLAAALLSTGTQEVLASDHSLTDSALLRLSVLFYSQQNWNSDPARALAQAQRQLAEQGVPIGEWAHVSILRAPPPPPTKAVRGPNRGP